MFVSRSLVDWILLRAWIEPDHEVPLRVVVKHPDRPSGEPVPEEAFADADRAASFVRAWLLGVVERWSRGERFVVSSCDDEDDLEEWELDAGDDWDGLN